MSRMVKKWQHTYFTFLLSKWTVLKCIWMNCYLHMLRWVGSSSVHVSLTTVPYGITPILSPSENKWAVDTLKCLCIFLYISLWKNVLEIHCIDKNHGLCTVDSSQLVWSTTIPPPPFLHPVTYIYWGYAIDLSQLIKTLNKLL